MRFKGYRSSPPPTISVRYPSFPPAPLSQIPPPPRHHSPRSLLATSIEMTIPMGRGRLVNEGLLALSGWLPSEGSRWVLGFNPIFCYVSINEPSNNISPPSFPTSKFHKIAVRCLSWAAKTGIVVGGWDFGGFGVLRVNGLASHS